MFALINSALLAPIYLFYIRQSYHLTQQHLEIIFLKPDRNCKLPSPIIRFPSLEPYLPCLKSRRILYPENQRIERSVSNAQEKDWVKQDE